MKTHNLTKPRHSLPQPGFASLLTVISVGMALMLILVSMYERTVESQQVEKNHMLRNDYQQREDAFLRAMATIIPNKAMICMQDDSSNTATTLNWKTIVDEAITISNSKSSVSSNIATTLGIDGMRNANSSNSQLVASTVVTPLAPASYIGQITNPSAPTGHWEDVTVQEWVPGYTIPGYQIYYWGGNWTWTSSGGWVNDSNLVQNGWIRKKWYMTPSTQVDGYWQDKVERRWIIDPVTPPTVPNTTGAIVTSGTNRAAITLLPPPLACSNSDYIIDANYPVVSLNKKYGTTSTGWVDDSVTAYPLYNRVRTPKLHFNYSSSPRMIAKHNWWAFALSFSNQDTQATKLTKRSKKYIISLYEIPAQLSINASSYAALGKHEDGSSWTNINTTGGIFAEKIKTEGSFSAQAISSRKGVNLSPSTNINGMTGSHTGQNPFAGHAREISQSKGETFPISSAADGGRVSFTPINRGLEFYDRYAGDRSTPDSTNAISPTSWDYYSIGANQCRMRMDIINVASSGNQRPTAIRFTYKKNGVDVIEEFTKGSGATWPEPSTTSGELFPFHVGETIDDRPAIVLHADRIQNFLAARGADATHINHSLSINADYVSNASIRKPSFPSLHDDTAVLLTGASDLTSFSKGFSLITNMRLIIADDTNIVEATPPNGFTLPNGEKYYPPLSMFAPEKRFGDNASAVTVDIDGQLGSLAKGNTAPTRIADFKSGSNDAVIPSNIRADLKPITHPGALPPINMMNWMVVIREIHPPTNNTQGTGP